MWKRKSPTGPSSFTRDIVLNIQSVQTGWHISQLPSPEPATGNDFLGIFLDIFHTHTNQRAGTSSKFFLHPLLTIFQPCLSHWTICLGSFYASTRDQSHFHSCILFHFVICLALVPMDWPLSCIHSLAHTKLPQWTYWCICMKVQQRCQQWDFWVNIVSNFNSSN